MLIAISQKLDKNKHDELIGVLENSYILFFEQFGIKLVPIPNLTQSVDYYFNHLPFEGVILTGGHDINPQLYGEEIDWPNITPQRDATEKRMLEIAVQKGLPVFGICRGIQFINVFFGGKLIKNIKNDLGIIHDPGQNHLIKIVDKEISTILGTATEVNSFHNQAITKETLSSQLKIFAEHDSIIEGIFHPKLPIAGIQWHPERKSPDEEINRKIVTAFAERELFWKK